MSPSEDQKTIAEHLRQVRACIHACCQEANRPVEAVQLIAVSKTHGVEAIEAALQAGQRVFGENRVQEAKGKWPALKQAWPTCCLHLIGPLQTNKVKEAVGLFDVIQTLDRERLADALVAERERSGLCPELFIQVNTGEEPQKAGILPDQADAFIRSCLEDKKLPVTGLMCIPPQDEAASLHFALLRDMARRHDLPHLSMGMSDDYELAIRLGATHIRVGSAIFGPRGQTAPAAI